MILPSTNCFAVSDGILSIKLQLFEKAVYGRNYRDENDTLRLKRLENSLFGECQIGTKGSRLQKLETKINEEKFKKALNREKVLLCMLEKRYFGEDYSKESIEERISRLEKVVFGKSINGPIQERYYSLIKIIPAQNGV